MDYHRNEVFLRTLFILLVGAILTGCGIPNLGGVIPPTPELLVISNQVQVRALNPANPVVDPNLRLLLAYEIYTGDRNEAQLLYQQTTDTLSGNISEGLRVDNGSSSLMTKFSDFEILLEKPNEVFVFGLGVGPANESLILTSTSIPDDVEADISLSDTTFFVGIFAFVKTIDSNTLEPRYSLISSHQPTGVFEF